MTTRGQLKLRLLVSSPLRPIADRAREFSRKCDELLAATAFVSDRALADVVETALGGKASVKFLTGTFGHVTRRRTFKRLHSLAGKATLESRVWDGDFHAKMLLWRRGAQGIGWIGSANLTDHGLQAEGEIVAEVRAAWSSAALIAMRKAFEDEWSRARLLDEAFIRAYKEAPRWALQFLRVSRQGRSVPPLKRHRRGLRGMLVVPVARHYAVDSPTAQRVTGQLGGTAHNWYRSPATALQHVRRGDACLIFDPIDGEVRLRTVTDRGRDGKGWVFAHDSYCRGAARPLTVRLRRQLARLGLSASARSFRTAWVASDTAAQIVEAIFGRGVRKRFASEGQE